MVGFVYITLPSYQFVVSSDILVLPYQKISDKKKREIANEANFILIEIPHFEDDISDEDLLAMIDEAIENE